MRKEDPELCVESILSFIKDVPLEIEHEEKLLNGHAGKKRTMEEAKLEKGVGEI